MKKILFICLVWFTLYNIGWSQDILYSSQTLTVEGNKVQILQSIGFSFADPGSCPPFDYSLNHHLDTLHINFYYDARGGWNQLGCTKQDTVIIDSLLPLAYTLIFHTNLVIGDFLNFDTLYNQDLDTAQIILTSNSNIDNHSFVSVYPNPIHQYLNIDVKSVQIQKIYLFNIQGQLIRSISKDKRRLKLDYLENGVYILRIKTNAGWINKKIIKQ